MDVIINDKYKKADKAGISFDVNFHYQDVDGIDVFDLGIILSNLLDNAVTACERISNNVGGNAVDVEKRYIRLSLKYRNQFLLLEVENSFDGILKNADDGLPQTTKDVCLPDILMEHGIGLRNVKDIAERYLGTMDIKVKGNSFTVMVMLQQPKEKQGF